MNFPFIYFRTFLTRFDGERARCDWSDYLVCDLHFGNDVNGSRRERARVECPTIHETVQLQIRFATIFVTLNSITQTMSAQLRAEGAGHGNFAVRSRYIIVHPSDGATLLHEITERERAHHSWAHSIESNLLRHKLQSPYRC